MLAVFEVNLKLIAAGAPPFPRLLFEIFSTVFYLAIFTLLFLFERLRNYQILIASPLPICLYRYFRRYKVDFEVFLKNVSRHSQ